MSQFCCNNKQFPKSQWLATFISHLWYMRALLSAMGLFHMPSDFRTHAEGIWDMLILWEEKNQRTGGNMHCLLQLLPPCVYVILTLFHYPKQVTASRSKSVGYILFPQTKGQKGNKYLLNSKAFSKPILLAGWGCIYIFVYICLKEYNDPRMLEEL